MKWGAGLASILIGIFSLTYVGTIGAIVGGGASVLGFFGPTGNVVSSWGASVQSLSLAAPLLAIVGGAVTFANPILGGVALGASAFLHYELLGFGAIGRFFSLSIAASAGLALISGANFSRDPRHSGEASSTECDRPSSQPAIDRARWAALVKYDKDIGEAVEKIKPLGTQWIDELASSFLALDDKSYLSEIIAKITARAEAEKAESERLRVRQRELLAARALEEQRLAEERKALFALWQQRLIGTPRKKTICGIVAAGFVAGALAIALWPGPPAPPPNAPAIADVNKVVRGETALHRAARAGDVALTEWLLRNGAEVSATDIVGETALFRATPQTADLLLQHGAKLDAHDNNGNTPLHQATFDAAQSGDTRLVAWLIDHNADVNAKNGLGGLPLDSADGPYSEKVASLLKAHGAKTSPPINKRTDTSASVNASAGGPCKNSDVGKDTNLFPLVGKADWSCVNEALNRGANVDARNVLGTSLLHFAAMQGSAEAILMLLNHGMDVNIRDKDGITALYFAVDAGHTQAVKALVEHGADVNAPGPDQRSPLWVASALGYRDIAEILLNNSANLNARDRQGTTALDQAERNAHQDIASMIASHQSRK